MVYICPWHTWFRKSSTLRVDFSPHSVLHHPPCCGDAKVFGLRGKFSFGDGVSTVLSGLHYYWICCKPWSKAIRSTPFCHWLQHWYKYLVSYQISQLIWRTKNLKSSPSFFFCPRSFMGLILLIECCFGEQSHTKYICQGWRDGSAPFSHRLVLDLLILAELHTPVYHVKDYD